MYGDFFMGIIFAIGSIYYMILIARQPEGASDYARLNAVICMWACIILMNMFHTKAEIKVIDKKLDILIERSVDTTIQ